MTITDQQALAAQSVFWDELRHWRILELRDHRWKALRDQNIGEDTPTWMDQDSEDSARMYIQFRALKAALESVEVE